MAALYKSGTYGGTVYVWKYLPTFLFSPRLQLTCSDRHRQTPWVPTYWASLALALWASSHSCGVALLFWCILLGLSGLRLPVSVGSHSYTYTVLSATLIVRSLLSNCKTTWKNLNWLYCTLWTRISNECQSCSPVGSVGWTQWAVWNSIWVLGEYTL